VTLVDQFRQSGSEYYPERVQSLYEE
jgi:hypothetical protein